MKKPIKEYLIYRNGTLWCITPEDRTEEALRVLKECYPLEDWELLEKSEREGK